MKRCEVFVGEGSQKLADITPIPVAFKDTKAVTLGAAEKINTVSTNMAGRGTDIKLGGNKDFKEDGINKNLDEHKENESKVKLTSHYELNEPEPDRKGEFH